jgi:predicted alpha/beta-hydrolase family hydrolase
VPEEASVLRGNNSSTVLTNSGALSPVDSAAALQIRSQWTMDALKMKRESAQAVQRRLQELRDRRAERRERARREARAAVDVREREIQKAKITLSGLAEHKKVNILWL